MGIGMAGVCLVGHAVRSAHFTRASMVCKRTVDGTVFRCRLAECRHGRMWLRPDMRSASGRFCADRARGFAARFRHLGRVDHSLIYHEGKYSGWVGGVAARQAAAACCALLQRPAAAVGCRPTARSLPATWSLPVHGTLMFSRHLDDVFFLFTRRAAARILRRILRCDSANWKGRMLAAAADAVSGTNVRTTAHTVFVNNDVKSCTHKK